MGCWMRCLGATSRVTTCRYMLMLPTAAEACDCCCHTADGLPGVTLAPCASCHETVCKGEPCHCSKACQHTVQHLRLDWRSRRLLPHNEAVHVVTRVGAVLCPTGSWAGA